MNANLRYCGQQFGRWLLGLAVICSASVAHSQQRYNPLRSGSDVRQAAHQQPTNQPSEPKKKIDPNSSKTPAPNSKTVPTEQKPTQDQSVIPASGVSPNIGDPGRSVPPASPETVVATPPRVVATRVRHPADPMENGTKSVLPPSPERIPSSGIESVPAPKSSMPNVQPHNAHSHSVQPQRMADAIHEGMVIESDAFPEIASGGCGGEMGCGLDTCNSCCLIPCPLFSFETLQVFGGVQGFTGPLNRGETGSFGFNEGVNWGTPLACFPDLAALQLGARATHSNLSAADSTSENRHQIFVTAGVFRRVDWGIQCGAVIDYLSDDWYYNIDLLQIRSELSWVFPCSHEIGFWFTGGLNSSQSVSNLDRQNVQLNERWEPTDLYAFFYRHRFDECILTEGRFYAGFTGESDGLIGADLRMPLNDRVAVSSGFTYLIPNQGEGLGINFGHAQESWNLGINLVWYPGCGGSRSANYSRPLFDVADNGSFMVDRDN